jgi:hypothetical protein
MTMSTMHLSDDDLVLHYYGELDEGSDARATAHVRECGECRRRQTQLQRVMAAVDGMELPALPEGFERTVWARLEPDLPARRGWLSWLVLSPGNLAWVSAVVLLVVGAFMAGRLTHTVDPAASELAAADQVREGVLLMDLEEHLDRSQTMLVELVSAEVDAGAVDMSVERERAQDLVAANRLYRQVAGQTGDVALRQLLDELERLLVELAASPDELPAGDMEQVQQRIAAKDLLFKVRVVSTALRERQRDQVRARNDIGT